MEYTPKNIVFSSEKLDSYDLIGGVVYLENNHYVLYVKTDKNIWTIFDDRVGSAMPTRNFKEIINDEFLYRDQIYLIYKWYVNDMNDSFSKIFIWIKNYEIGNDMYKESY